MFNKTEFSFYVIFMTYCSSPIAWANCAIPHALANGQVADASKVMDDFEAVAACADAAVAVTGSPAPGALSVFSGSSSVSVGDLSGDVTTSGSTVTTLSNSGVTPGFYTNAAIAIDAKGRITSATNGSGGGGGGAVIAAHIRRMTSQSIAASTAVAISFDTEVRDNGDLWSAASPTRLTAPVAGWYNITGGVHWAARTGNGRRVFIRKNGSTFLAYSSTVADSAHNDPFVSTTAIVYLDASGPWSNWTWQAAPCWSSASRIGNASGSTSSA